MVFSKSLKSCSPDLRESFELGNTVKKAIGNIFIPVDLLANLEWFQLARLWIFSSFEDVFLVAWTGGPRVRCLCQLLGRLCDSFWYLLVQPFSSLELINTIFLICNSSSRVCFSKIYMFECYFFVFRADLISDGMKGFFTFGTFPNCTTLLVWLAALISMWLVTLHE